MASSGKKGKKSKGKTVPLTDFLQESTVNVPVKKYGSWSEEVDDQIDGILYESRNKSNVVLPTAPRAARCPDLSDDRIPIHGPYIAYISNLPYDIDERDIAEFFEDMRIESMRLPRDDRGSDSGKLKGFGYVVFEDKASLVDALSILDTNLKGRRIKIDIASNIEGDRKRGGRMDIGRDRPERPEVAMGDWRAGPRTDPVPEGRGGGGGGGGFGHRDGPPESNRSGAWRDAGERPSFRDSERGGFTRETMNREPMSREGMNREPMSREPMNRENMNREPMSREGMGGDRDRDRYQDRGNRFSDRDRDGDRRGGGGSYGNRRYGDREGGGYDRERREGGGGGYDRDRREDRGGDGEFRRAPPRDDGPPADKDQRSRPKLVLAPRSKPVEEQTDDPEKTAPAPVAAPVPAASIFGAAKPVDTSARERQIEERLAKEKEVRPAPRDSSRDRPPKEDEEERPPKQGVWVRKRSDDEAPRKESPERRPTSRGPPPRRNDDKRPGPGPRDTKAPPRRDEKPPAKKEERPLRDNHERELPKLKEPESINFFALNLYAALEPEDDVSD